MEADPSEHRPVIPEAFDPTFEGEPTAEIDPETPDEESSDVLQMREDRSAFESVADPEDETLELPNEEQAMHVTYEPRQ